MALDVTRAKRSRFSSSSQAPLTLDAETMRRMGYRAIDAVVDHLTQIRQHHVLNVKSGRDLQRVLGQPLPREPEAFDTLIGDLEQHVFQNITHHDHPRFFAFVPGPGNYAGALAELLTNGFNVFCGTWIGGAGASEIELITLEWLRRLVGFPAGARGVFLSGGSEAGLVAMATARNVKLGNDPTNAVVYCSDQTHKSLDRNLWLLGFQPQQVVRLPCDETWRLRPELLAARIAGDRAKGLRPFCVVVNAGTTNTGSVDPLNEVAEICRREDLWLHADGAYGAGAIFCEPGRKVLSGIEKVDSLGLDPHKWMFQPYSAGCVMVRNGYDLRRTFSYSAEYLKLIEESDEPNFCDYGIQLTRDFRALKLWFSLKIFGADAFEAAQCRGIELAETVAKTVVQQRWWELVSPPQLAVVTFRFRPPGLDQETLDALNREIVDTFNKTGYGMVIYTKLNEETVIRMCTINPRTLDAEIQQCLEKLDHIAKTLYREWVVTEPPASI
ncbi:pyridoxal phosphate-dependent decarboxylase family protein [Acanthopleuribacter pedis]|uniref:Aspartate aminotransferase family protein n=1 Tax=Acanthopleuribacter pedis TaxID=442870 RepID=A0A8J7Q746_9BACT|nr:aspartate aminotransferase family protein [Acanthopleuribacter pedis]MBO1321817.1 aspartate aminotransferase family protein [Acanthopleuribacter pedis]